MEDQILDYEEKHFSVEQHTANAGKRFGNYMIDRILCTVMVFGFIELVGKIGSYSLREFMEGISLLLFPCYWIIFEYFFQKTPGKFITQTTVLTIYGDKPTFLNTVGRTLCRFIPFEQFSFLGSRAVGWHDSISKTRVVEDRFLPDNYRD